MPSNTVKFTLAGIKEPICSSTAVAEEFFLKLPGSARILI
jgi:hypothetical protein